MAALEWMLAAAFVIGVAFGAVGQISGFCLMNGLRGWWCEGDGRGIRAFALAVAVAVAGTAAIAAAGWVDLGKSIYRTASVSYPVLIAGGLLFGYGMVLANGCGARALVLLGRGNLRSFVVIVCLVIAAQATLKGVLAPVRQAAQQATALQVKLVTLADAVGATGFAAAGAAWAAAVAALLLAGFALAHAPLRASPRHWLGGLLIGLLIPAGWLASGLLGADDFEPAPVASLSFVAPLAEAVLGLMLSTGGVAAGIGTPVVTGVLVGAFAAALANGGMQLEGFATPRTMLRYMAGGTLMGIGGVMALGCSIGQGLSGVSTLALGSLAAITALLAGAFVGLRGPLRVG
ncbi:MAG: YeeE/YedE family protein [Lautropia sp.]